MSNYTDFQLLRAAQIAYYDINASVIEEATRNADTIDGNSSCTLKELYDNSADFRNSIYKSIAKTS